MIRGWQYITTSNVAIFNVQKKKMKENLFIIYTSKLINWHINLPKENCSCIKTSIKS